jgi:hypothetical protein
MNALLSTSSMVMFCNAVTVVCFFLVFYARYPRMDAMHRAAYIAIIAGLGINLVLLYLGERTEPRMGEAVASIGFALLSIVAVDRNGPGVMNCRKIGFWF